MQVKSEKSHMMLINAIYDLDSAKVLFNEEKKRSLEDRIYNNTCYHIQQCIEKALKYILKCNDVRYQYTRDINELSYEVDQLNLEQPISSLISKIFTNATTYTSWETRSRYFGKFRESEQNVIEALDICVELIKYCNSL